MSQQAKMLLGIGSAALLIFVGVLLIFGSGPSKTTTNQTDKLARPDSFMIGPANAKVQVVEFGDFQCPACAAAAPIFEKVINDYKDRVRFVFRHFPLPAHANALISAQAAEAAGVQGKFWEMYQILYSRQSAWDKSDNPKDIFLSYAAELKLDTARFKDALDNFKDIDRIRADQKDGQDLGVNATPTFFIGATAYPGVMSYDQFKALLDPQL